MRSTDGLSRRDVLRAAGGSLAVGSVAGVGAAGRQNSDAGPDETTRFNVGYRNRRGRREAESRATSVVYDHPTAILTVVATPDALDGLEADPGVRFVERDIALEALQRTPYGIEKVNAPEVHDAGETGNGVDVAIIDTGIESTHPDLASNVGQGRAFTGGVGYGVSEDGNGHGTHCAGIVGAIDNDSGVVGVAPDVTLHPVKVLNASGVGLTSDIAAGIEWTGEQGYDVANLSLGGGGTQTLQEACQFASKQGTLLVAAAGNDGPCEDCVSAPAAYPECMAVSATGPKDNLAEFSSTGPEIEIAAPGDNVESTYLLGGYDSLSGTSMAAPHVAGAAAHLRGNGYGAEAARQQLKDSAVDVGLGDNEAGAGRLDVAAALDG